MSLINFENINFGLQKVKPTPMLVQLYYKKHQKHSCQLLDFWPILKLPGLKPKKGLVASHSGLNLASFESSVNWGGSGHLN